MWERLSIAELHLITGQGVLGGKHLKTASFSRVQAIHLAFLFLCTDQHVIHCRI